MYVLKKSYPLFLYDRSELGDSIQKTEMGFRWKIFFLSFLGATSNILSSYFSHTRHIPVRHSNTNTYKYSTLINVLELEEASCCYTQKSFFDLCVLQMHINQCRIHMWLIGIGANDTVRMLHWRTFFLLFHSCVLFLCAFNNITTKDWNWKFWAFTDFFSSYSLLSFFFQSLLRENLL